MRDGFHQPFSLKLPDRLTDDGTTHLECVLDNPIGQVLTRGETPLDDRSPQTLLDLAADERRACDNSNVIVD